MATFSYKKFTELQMQGAKDRSLQSVEESQNARRLQRVTERWMLRLVNRDEDDEVIALHQKAIEEVFASPETPAPTVDTRLFPDDADDGSDRIDDAGAVYSDPSRAETSTEEQQRQRQQRQQLASTAQRETFDGVIFEEVPPRSACLEQQNSQNRDSHNVLHREMSPFMTARLAQISCQEYKNIIGTRCKDRLRNDVRLLVNWLHEVAEHQERLGTDTQQSLQQQTAEVRTKYAEVEAHKQQQLRNILIERRALLTSLRDRKLDEIRQRQQAVDSLRDDQTGNRNVENMTGTTASLETPPQLEEASESSEWVDVDDDEDSSNDEWIECSK